jgi:hypothetical protein
MHVLGIVGYVILSLLATMWLLGVRTQLGCGIPVILSSLFLLAGTVVLPFSGQSLLHSWWMIPAGYGVGILAGPCLRVPVVGAVLHLVGSLYAGIVRIGVDPARVEEALVAADLAAIEEWSQQQGVGQRVTK